MPPFTLFFFATLAGFFEERDLSVCFFTPHCRQFSFAMHALIAPLRSFEMTFKNRRAALRAGGGQEEFAVKHSEEMPQKSRAQAGADESATPRTRSGAAHGSGPDTAQALARRPLA